jgi:lipopolysaccharide export LptBFGC system permease protein LptF
MPTARAGFTCRPREVELTGTAMKLIDRFISRELLINFVFAVAVLSFVLVLGQILRRLLPLLINHDVPVEYLVTFIAYILPFSLIFTIP